MAMFSSDLMDTFSDEQLRFPQCKFCKKTLSNPTDRKKTVNGWWSNCQKCRNGRAERSRQQRKRKETAVAVHKTLRPSSDRFANANQWWKENKKYAKCAECGESPDRPWMTSCGHVMCDPCYEDAMNAAAETKQSNCSCRACGLKVNHGLPINEEFEPLLSDAAEKRKRKLERRDRKTAKMPQLIECSVCGDSFVGKDLPILSACTHKADVCKGCLLEWLNTQLESTTWEKMQCPSNGCGQSITHADVRKYAPDEFFNRFDELSMRAFLSADPDFRYCLAEGCTSGQIHDKGTEGNIFRCNACNFRVCSVHDVPFHTDETCAQYDTRLRKQEEQRQREDRKRKRQNEMSLSEINANSMKCPGCEVPIHKYEACDHITCTRCQFEFCYVCRAPYQGDNGIFSAGNIVHYVECKYHPQNLPGY